MRESWFDLLPDLSIKSLVVFGQIVAGRRYERNAGNSVPPPSETQGEIWSFGSFKWNGHRYVCICYCQGLVSS